MIEKVQKDLDLGGLGKVNWCLIYKVIEEQRLV